MSKYVSFILLALFALLVAPAAASLISPAADLLQLEPVECVVDVPATYIVGEDVLCYSLTVPARYDDPDGQTIRLAVMVIRATGADRKP